jgi:hypothetical protein
LALCENLPPEFFPAQLFHAGGLARHFAYRPPVAIFRETAALPTRPGGLRRYRRRRVQTDMKNQWFTDALFAKRRCGRTLRSVCETVDDAVEALFSCSWPPAAGRKSRLKHAEMGRFAKIPQDWRSTVRRRSCRHAVLRLKSQVIDGRIGSPGGIAKVRLKRMGLNPSGQGGYARFTRRDRKGAIETRLSSSISVIRPSVVHPAGSQRCD